MQNDATIEIGEVIRRRKAALESGTLPGLHNGSASTYTWGQPLVMGRAGNARRYLVSGWSGDEDGFVWTEGHVATLNLGVADPQGDVVLRLRARALLPSDRAFVQARLRVNGVLALAWAVGGHDTWLEGLLFRPLLQGCHSLALALELETPVSPSSIGMGTDARLLGLAVSEIRLNIIN